MRTQWIAKEESSFIGIDYHKRSSVFCVLDTQGAVLERDASITSVRSDLFRWCGDGLGVAWSLRPA
jgi:hypothetical protein